MASTLNKATYFDGLNPFSYVVRETDGCVYHVYLDQDTMFAGRWKSLLMLEGKYFDEDNQIFNHSLHVAIAK